MSELIQLPPNFLDLLAYHHENLYRGNPIYTNYEIILKKYIDTVHSSSSLPFSLAEIGEVYFPYFQMGKRNSSHLFGLDELIIFALYYTKKKQYKLALDLGANLGLHSLVLKKMGYEVCSFEPDPTHIKQFQKVMLLNSIQTDFLQKKAISTKSGLIDFVRVLNNTTGSHLMGSKNPYGPVEIFKIEVVDIVEVLESKNFDIIKMDVEGHEAELITHLPPKFFDFVDFVLEIGSEINALRIFDFLKNHKIPIYTQKNGWKIASTWREIPIHHSEGSAFISKTKKPFL